MLLLVVLALPLSSLPALLSPLRSERVVTMVHHTNSSSVVEPLLLFAHSKFCGRLRKKIGIFWFFTLLTFHHISTLNNGEDMPIVCSSGEREGINKS
jgi:hypothetical protein